MATKKIIEVTDEISSVLDEIGDAALKFGGIKIFNFVRKLSDAVKIIEEPNPAPAIPSAPVEQNSPVAPAVDLESAQGTKQFRSEKK